jgi:NAD(P)-dependent dehydrogenase (short-subunit alcohol dehydrogenase family)
LEQSNPTSKGFNPHGRAVLITGCSSGIGRATAVYNAQKGFTVFATVRDSAHADELKNLQLPELIPVFPVDLTRSDHIANAFKKINTELEQRDLPGLYALIHNAGGGSIAPIELIDLEKYHIELQVRLLAPVSLLQTFLPLLRNARGRVVWIQTPALIPTPYVVSIHSCDFAANCLARTLNIELKPWRIPSIMIRCGGIQTPASDKSYRELDDAIRSWEPERYRLYADGLERTRKEFSEFDAKRTNPQEVAKAVYKALCATKPKHRYQVGHMSGMAAFLESLPQSIADWMISMRN